MSFRDDLSKNMFSIFICPRTQMHTHSHNFLELAYVLKGEATHIRDNTATDIKEGDYFVIDYRSQHSYVAKTDEFELINCLFLPEFIDAALFNCRSLQTLISNYQIRFKTEFFIANPSESLFTDDDKKIKSLLLNSLDEYKEKSPGYLQLIRSRVVEILILTMRKIYSDPKPEAYDSNMSLILKYINSEYMNDITLNEICKKFGYSFSYLSAKFKNYSGLTYTAYLQKTRIEQSMRLLAHTDRSINEIATDVGYKDTKTYYTVFKKIANTTPAKFRKNFSK